MHPILFSFDLFGRNYPVGTYGVMMLFAVVAGYMIPRHLARKFNYDLSDVSVYSILVISSGLFGAIFTGFIIFLPERLAGTSFWTFPIVFVSWGGILGGLVCALILKATWKVHFLNLADIGTPAYLMAIGLGRIGCHFGGCCHGIHTDAWFGITFTDPIAPASAFQPQPLVPTQLISAVFLIIASLVFIPITLRRKIPGVTFFLSVIVYTTFRFIIEYWRADMRKFFLGFSDGQTFSIIMYVISVVALIMIYRKKKKLIKTIDRI